MTRLVVTLLAIVLLHLAAAHELCSSSLDPQDVTLSFCPEYSGHSCCSVERDAQIAAEYNAIVPQAPSDCDQFLRRMFCAEWYPTTSARVSNIMQRPLVRAFVRR